MKGLKDKVVVLAGSGALGTSLCERLAEEGAHVVVGSRRLESAQKSVDAATAAGGEAIAVACDVGDEQAVNDLVSAAKDRFGGIDGLVLIAVNTSLQPHDTDILEAPMSVFDDTITTNLRGHVLVVRAALPSMLQRGGGGIVFISSEAALIGASYGHFYGVGKSGLNALARHVAFEYGKQGIRANALSLDMVWTEHMADVTPQEAVDERLELSRTPELGTPEDIAGAISFLLAEECKTLQGQTIALNAGIVMR